MAKQVVFVPLERLTSTGPFLLYSAGAMEADGRVSCPSCPPPSASSHVTP